MRGVPLNPAIAREHLEGCEVGERDANGLCRVDAIRNRQKKTRGPNVLPRHENTQALSSHGSEINRLPHCPWMSVVARPSSSQEETDRRESSRRSITQAIDLPKPPADSGLVVRSQPRQCAACPSEAVIRHLFTGKNVTEMPHTRTI